jgi:two-component sensor histidine kinase
MDVRALGSPPRLAPEAVFISDALRTRPPRRTDVVRAKNVLQALAARMADNPADILPYFVDQAMELTGGDSAGLSLYDPDTAPEVFEWRHLRGTLARFERATTPRDHSPCGITLDSNAPTLATYPERVYHWISDAGITVPEVLLVPLYIGGSPLGTLWVVSDNEGHFDGGDAATMSELAGFVGIALRMAQNEALLRSALDEQETVAKEMSHRLKNVFAMAEGMIRVSARSADSTAAMAEALSGRLHAMASAHAIVRRKVSDMAGIAPTTDLGDLIRAIVKAHEEVDRESPFKISGLPISCGDHATNGIALLIHELATNARKYGALSESRGQVAIAWHAENNELRLSWIETGGPPLLGPPVQSGFGATLAERTVKGQFRGSLTLDWRSEGLAVHMSLNLDRVAA